MAKKNAKKQFHYLETWNTRYGSQTRIVTHQNGRFVGSTPSLETMRKGIPVTR